MNAEQIARALGLHRAGSGYSGECPCCHYRGGFSIKDRDGRTLVHCAAGDCSQTDLIETLRALGLWPEWHDGAGQPQPEEDDKTAMALAIWQRSRPEPTSPTGIIGPVGTYLRQHRGYTGPLSAVLRSAYGQHPTTGRQRHLMMIAPMMLGDEFIALHRTFLGPGCAKADLDPVKMTLGPTEGAAIRLFAAAPTLIVAEGIENGLFAAHWLNLPAWAAFSAGNMPKLALPEIVAEVIIAADRDPHGLGQRKAEEAAYRWSNEGRRVRLLLPPPGRGDWADYLRVR